MLHDSDADALVLDISSRLLATSSEESDAIIVESLGRIASFLGANAASLQHVAPDGRSVLRTHAWGDAGAPAPPADHLFHRRQLDRDTVPWLFAHAKPGARVLVKRVEDLPPEAAGERTAMLALGIESMAWIASSAADAFATLALAWVGRGAEIDERILDRFAISADLFGAALRRQASERALQRRIDAEELLLDLSGRFLDIEPEQVDGAIVGALRDIARFLGANRASFSLAVEGGAAIALSHEWGARIASADDAPQFGERYPSRALAWVVEAVRNGEGVFIPDLTHPPAGAEQIAATAAAFGVRAQAWVPARARGQVVGAIALAWIGREACIDASELRPFSLAADVIATALRRRRTLLALRRRAEIDRLVLEISSRFLDCPIERVDAEIEHTLRELATFTGADRVVLDASRPGVEGLVRMHAVGAPVPERFVSTGRTTNIARLDSTPRATDAGGRSLNTGMASIDDLPPDAIVRAEMAELGVHTAAWLIARVGETPVGMILLMWMKSEVAVERADLPGLAVLADILSTVLRRRETERALRESEQRFRAMASSAPLIVFTCDPKGRITFLSERARQIAVRIRVGASFDQWLGELHPDDRGRVREAFLAARSARSSFELECRLAVGDRWRAQLVNGAPRIDEDGALLGYVGTIHDITDRKQLEADLRRAQKMEAVGRLAGGIAHDFNNILTAVIGHVDGARHALQRGEPASRDLEGIEAAARRAASLTHQLLAFSRHQIIEPHVVDVNGIVAGVETLLRRVLGEQVLLEVSLAPEAGCVRVDRGQIEQVLINLAANARDAMPAGGSLRIVTDRLPASAARARAGAPAGWARISVRDTGEGMDEQTLAHAFEPFFTTKEIGRGTGLGLATCYGIVQQSGGHIDVRSQPGVGTTFEILLPVVEAPAEPASELAARAHPVSGSETVLVVEDDPAVQSILRRVLQHGGYSVHVASDGVAARAVAGGLERPVDVLVTDLVMPGESGTQVAAWARDRWPGIRVLYVSGYSSVSPPEVESGAPGAGFLAKPFAPSELTRRIRELLDS